MHCVDRVLKNIIADSPVNNNGFGEIFVYRISITISAKENVTHIVISIALH